MDENRFRQFQVILKIATALGAIVVFFVGLHRWHVEQAALIETRISAEQAARDREFRRELWLRQIEMLATIADTASLIAASVDDEKPDAFDAAVRAYERIYWGNVTFVEDSDLVQAMDALRHEVRIFREGLEPFPPGGLGRHDRVKQRAYAVSLACRKTVRESGRNYIVPLEADEASD